MDYKIEHFQKFKDHRGALVVFLRKRDLNKKQVKFGQIYFVTFSKKGIIRGNHYHKKWREWFGVIHGKVQLRLKDVKSKKVKNFTINGDSKNYIRIEIGPYISHSFKSLTDKASLLNYTDSEWSSDDTFPLPLFKERKIK